MKRRQIVIVPLIVLLLFASACANKQVATNIDFTIVKACEAFQKTEISAHTGGKVSDDTHGKIMYQMGTVWRLAGQYNLLVRDWPGTGQPPTALLKIAGDIAGTMRLILDLLPGTDPDSMKSAKQILSIVEGVLKFVGVPSAAH